MKLRLEKHFSPDADKTYYYILADNFPVYSAAKLKAAKERFKHITDIGITAYMQEITIQKVLILEEDIEAPGTPTNDNKDSIKTNEEK